MTIGPRNVTQSATRNRAKGDTTRTPTQTQTPRTIAVGGGKSERSRARRKRRRSRRSASALANTVSIARTLGCIVTRRIPRMRGSAKGYRTAIGVPPRHGARRYSRPQQRQTMMNGSKSLPPLQIWWLRFPPAPRRSFLPCRLPRFPPHRTKPI